MNCTAKGALFLDPQHHESWMRIQEMENRRTMRDVTPGLFLTSLLAKTLSFPSTEQRYPPPTFTQPLENADNLSEGDAVRLQCRLEPANDPTMRVVWLRNDEPLAQGN